MRALVLAALLIPFAAQAGGIDLTRQVWNGPAICYSGYRAGQHPDRHIYPTRAQILEDLRLVERRWKIIRLYGADQHSEDVLAVIRAEKLDLKVILGIWLSSQPSRVPENPVQVSTAIRLANEYPGIVAAVSVGNEALVSWSDHRMNEDDVLAFVRTVKRSVRCAVTIADDHLYWEQPSSAKLVDAIDFITMHSYPVWAGQPIDTGLSTTIEHFQNVRRAHPGKTIVIGEAGWPTYTEGNSHAPGAGSEANQRRYYGEITGWAKTNQVTVFVFEAFDEPWKGTGTEGHWGLYTESRQPKPVLADRN